MSELIEQQPKDPRVEIETLLANMKPIPGPEGSSLTVVKTDVKTIDDGSKVRLTFNEYEGKPNEHSLSQFFPEDEMSRQLAIRYDFSKGKYEKLKIGDYRAGEAAQILQSRPLGDYDEAEALTLLEKFKEARDSQVEDEVVDDGDSKGK